jgi:Tfp pilus assembly protein PilF
MALTKITDSPSNTVSADPSSGEAKFSSALVLSLVLFLGTITLYLSALGNGFVNYDDPAYVTANTRVLHGLSWSNISWALTATTEANWHPLTWISHMADVQFFGLNPRAHHLVNVVLHALNVLVLFLVLYRATGYMQRSAVTAGVFAVHPMNVECVAWVAERKSLLSMLFMLLALLAYESYVRNRRFERYLTVVLFFALGLAAKPMVIMFPFLLLLWDYWPLRFGVPEAQTNGRTFLKLVAEKLPLFTMAAGSAWITLYAQHKGGALGSTDLLPLKLRLDNAVYSYVVYIVKGLWPSPLAVFYPHPENSLATWKILAAALLIVIATALTWFYRKRRYLLMGWLWYLVAMIPMIGIFQVGRQAMADRYAYLPFVGLFIVAVWGVAELSRPFMLSKFISTAIILGLLAGYASVSYLQIHYWRNSYTLFSHAIQVTNRNGIAEDNLGNALVEMGKPDLALPHFEAALEFMPQLSTAHYDMAVLLQQHNQLDQAKREYELALSYGADATEAAQSHSNLGFVLMQLNRPGEAIQQFTAALRVNPDKQNSLLGRGMIEYGQRNLAAALADFSRAAQVSPMPIADFWLGRTLEDLGQLPAALNAYSAALQLNPKLTEAEQHINALRAKIH